MKTGDIIGVKGTKWLSKRIQDFQFLADEESYYINHTGIIYIDSVGTVWVIESDYLTDWKLKAPVKPTLLSEYMESDAELFLFQFNELLDIRYDEGIIIKEIFRWMGYPYDFKNLLGDQIILTLSQWVAKKINKPGWELWLGRTNRHKKRLICHEYSQLVWNEYSKKLIGSESGIFEQCNKGKVSEVFNSKYFKNVVQIK